MADQDTSFPLLLVGAGRMGTAWIQALGPRPATAKGAFLAAVCDPDPARGGATLPLPGLMVEPELEPAARRVRPAGAILATPPDTHEALALQLLEWGIPVLCEKPLAPAPEGAERILAASRTLGVPLLPAMKYRFVSDLQRAAELLAAGILGQPVHLQIAFAAPVAGPLGWRADPARSGGGVIADNGPHAADLARWLLGPVTRVAAFPLPRVLPIPVEDSAWLALRHAGGALSTVWLSWVHAAPDEWYLRLQGTGGVLQAGWQGARYRVQDAPDWVAFGDGYRRDQALARMAGAFAAAVRGEAPFPVGAGEALAGVQVVAAAAAALAAPRGEGR